MTRLRRRPRASGAVHQVSCIKAPCSDMPSDIARVEGTRVDNADLNGVYVQRADFEPLPAK